ncbi:MAG: hypothetical protein MUC63_04320, partial [Planctomycetes bacterium]|nr:hypothetical protein [Planctomycetota bacterium]
YALSLPEGAFAVPEFPSPRSRLEQGSEDRLVLPLERWVCAGLRGERAVRLGGGLGLEPVGWEFQAAGPEDRPATAGGPRAWTTARLGFFRIRNALPSTVEGAMVLLPVGVQVLAQELAGPGIPVFARGIRIPPSGTAEAFLGEGRHLPFSEEDRDLLALLLFHQNRRLRLASPDYVLFGGWVRTENPDLKLAGSPLKPVRDRTALIVAGTNE